MGGLVRQVWNRLRYGKPSEKRCLSLDDAIGWAFHDEESGDRYSVKARISHKTRVSRGKVRINSTAPKGPMEKELRDAVALTDLRDAAVTYEVRRNGKDSYFELCGRSSPSGERSEYAWDVDISIYAQPAEA